MIGYLDFVYTKDGRFGMILSFNNALHKFRVGFNCGKPNESSEYFYQDDLKVVV